MTDLHIGLSPTTAPSPDVGHLWLADGHAYAANEFGAGQETHARATVSNTTERDMEATVRWTTTDPQGRNLPELSDSGDYALPPFPVDLLFTSQVSSGSPMGQYRTGIEVACNNQTRYADTQFWVGADQWVCLPLAPFNLR